MDDNNISEKLKLLAKSKNRSATSRIREIFDQIEAALQAGVRRKDVHKALNEDGFEITLESFELAIYRIRKERGKQQKCKVTNTPVSSIPGVLVPDRNPFSVLTGKPKDGEHNAIPTAKFELDSTEKGN